MKQRRNNKQGFTLIEVLVAMGIFLLFAVGVYGAMAFVSKIVYQSRMTILETAVLSEELEIARNLPYVDIGTVGGVPAGPLQQTKTVVRDGASFRITTSVTNQDDPFDGTLSGYPADTSFADYKLVEMSAICISCTQKTPVTISTIVGPKALEGATQNGALFINVFDANGQPVPDADVHIWNTSVSPAISINASTDNDGYYRLIDTPTGTAAYGISVTKSGYSTDYTITSTVANPNPTKPKSNVATQRVTDISLSIDKLSNLSVHTINQACVAVPSIGLSMVGSKLLGTSPTVYKVSSTLTTDGSGNRNISNVEWDTYNFGLTGAAYDIAGSIPLLPVFLTPDTNQDLTVILRAHSANSLLVQVEDASTQLPLSNVTAHLTGPSSYDRSVLTGLGYIRQTNWASGSGSASFVEGRYFSDNGFVSVSASPGDIVLSKSGQNYTLSQGILTSGTFDLGTVVNFNNVLITPTTQPVQAGTQSVKMQIATSNSSTPASWLFLGPDGTAGSYYTVTNTLIAATSSGKRYMRYQVTLSTINNKFTPTFSEVAFTYTDSCIPPGQTFFDSLTAGSYTLMLSAVGYVDSTTTIDVDGNDIVRIPMAD